MITRCALFLVVGTVLQFGPLRERVFATDLREMPGIGLKDTPPDYLPIWPGFYFGGHAGGVWGNTGTHDTFTYVGDPAFNGSLSSTGFIGGAQAGYNFQRGHFVFGIEGDAGYLGISANKSASFKPSSCTGYYTAGQTVVQYTGNNARMCAVDAKYSSASDLYGDLTGRLGYLFDRTLVYAKGGASLLNEDFKANYSGANCMTIGSCGIGGPSSFNFGRTNVLLGWTAGAGAEYALTPSLSVKAEYQHFDFGSMSYGYSGTYSIPCTGCNHAGGHYTSTINGKLDASLTADAVTLGLNYHLNN
jgi:outer membrane immunogenic protein